MTKNKRLTTSSEARSLSSHADLLNTTILDAISDIKGKKVVKLDLTSIEDSPTDYFIICEGDSITQVRALSENIKRKVKEELAIYPAHLEGQLNAKWICVDYFSTVVHVFYPETREFYGLEELWSDAVVTEYDQL